MPCQLISLTSKDDIRGCGGGCTSSRNSPQQQQINHNIKIISQTIHHRHTHTYTHTHYHTTHSRHLHQSSKPRGEDEIDYEESTADGPTAVPDSVSREESPEKKRKSNLAKEIDDFNETGRGEGPKGSTGYLRERKKNLAKESEDFNETGETELPKKSKGCYRRKKSKKKPSTNTLARELEDYNKTGKTEQRELMGYLRNRKDEERKKVQAKAQEEYNRRRKCDEWDWAEHYEDGLSGN